MDNTIDDYTKRKEEFKATVSIALDDNSEENYEFDPEVVSKEIEKEKFYELAELLKGTPDEDLIAFEDPKLKELIGYILPAIIGENTRINNDPYPIEIYSRYKSFNSLKDKTEDYSERQERKNVEIPDCLGIRIVPESEYTVFYADGNLELQEMIDKREDNRQFIATKYKELSETPDMTVNEYCLKCQEVLGKLKEVFPEEAIERRKYYEELEKTIKRNYEEYKDTVEDSNEIINFNEISDIVEINIRSLLIELKKHNPNEVTLYKLKRDLMNTFEQSELLKSLRIIYIK